MIVCCWLQVKSEEEATSPDTLLRLGQRYAEDSMTLVLESQVYLESWQYAGHASFSKLRPYARKSRLTELLLQLTLRTLGCLH